MTPMTLARLPQLWPVVDASIGLGARSYPWQFRADVGPIIRLSANLTLSEIGHLFCLLTAYNNIHGESIDEIEAGILSAEMLMLPGGIQVEASDGIINPGCCCGLEAWR